MKQSIQPQALSIVNDVKSIAISGLHRGENPQPGGAVIASIRRLLPEVRIVGLSYDPIESSLYSKGEDHLDAAYLMPYPDTGEDALLERLSMIIKKENVGYIIPCLDMEIPNFISIYQQLNDWGVQCVLPSQRSLGMMNKLNIYHFCQQINISSPKAKVATDLLLLQKFATEIGYPVYVKGRFYEAQIAHSPEDLIQASQKISRIWGWPLIVQEVINGEEYDIIGLGDGEGGIIKACAIRKFQRSATGKGFAGVVVENPELERLAQIIIRELQWNGPFELEFLKAPSKPYSLFEVNPRFPAWVDFPSQIGCNLPVRLVQDLIGIKPTPLQKCNPGQMFVRHSVDLVGDIAELADMSNTGEHIMTPYKSQAEATE